MYSLMNCLIEKLFLNFEFFNKEFYMNRFYYVYTLYKV